ncbi:MAG TPA: hypothetical protein PL151_13900 [Phycisphaerae bacterium]|nr:hypothetical protein [Phycisphaerae bacterium]HOJ72368.1 hypothetical protein [Phycisphaerae bacterium]HOM49970.1 hypothetical protein [Phycisphaerae bacterium]HON68538.1 hypothetical protein [Phycisphaerae bacterium]HOQ84597.1 hypothetical protein [Phycisphaerae bacterium]
MKDTPEYLEEFARSSGIDTSSWRTWHTESMLSVSGIRERAHALALRNFITERMSMEAEVNEPPHPDGDWAVVAIPAPRAN